MYAMSLISKELSLILMASKLNAIENVKIYQMLKDRLVDVVSLGIDTNRLAIAGVRDI